MVQTEKDKLLSRIKKMLALANDVGATEGERDTAMRHVHTLLAKHNLTIAEAEAAGTQAQEKRIESTTEMVGHAWAKSCVYAIAELYFCKYFIVRLSNKSFKVRNYFIGREANVITAQEMSQFITRSISKEASRRQREMGSDGGWHRSFCNGAAHRVYERCMALRREAERASEVEVRSAPGTALVLASFYEQELAANDALCAANGHRLSKSKGGGRISARSGAYGAGRAFGEGLGLHRGVTDSRIKGRLQ